MAVLRENVSDRNRNQSVGLVIDGHGFALGTELRALLFPGDVAAALRPIGAVCFGLVCGLLTAAVGAARSGDPSFRIGPPD